MYDEFAHLWPLISPHADYIAEAKVWRAELTTRLGPGRHEILELGVGGGHNLHHVLNPSCEGSRASPDGCGCRRDNASGSTFEFDVTAVDISEKMLAGSKQLNPDAEHLVGDMRSVRLGRTYDAVLIHDAITCLVSEDELHATFETVKYHLKPSGLFITTPDWYAETFPGVRASHDTNRDGEKELTYFSYSHVPDQTETKIETIFIYMIKEDGQLRTEQDRHIAGLFPLDTWVSLLAQSGFHVEKLPYGDDNDDGHDAHLFVSALIG